MILSHALTRRSRPGCASSPPHSLSLLWSPRQIGVKRSLRPTVRTVTLAQLQSFVLVARHGSVKAAAAELEVTEPAVSVAVAALRRELGDELFVRHGRGIALTPGGRKLAALAGEILSLAEQARRSVASESRRLVVAATPTVAEHVGPLIDAFAARDPELELSLTEVPAAAFAEALEHRRADIALGPSPGATGSIAAAPFLRCRFVIV